MQTIASSQFSSSNVTRNTLANLAALRFGSCCGGAKKVQDPPPASNSAHQPNHDTFVTQTPEKPKSCPSKAKNKVDVATQTESEQSLQPAPTQQEAAQPAKEEKPSAPPSKSIWQKASDWFKQWIEILFKDLEALFSGPKAPCPKAAAEAEKKKEQQAATEKANHCSGSQASCASQPTLPTSKTSSACH